MATGDAARRAAAAELLRGAARMVGEALEKLNAEGTRCGCCGLLHYADKDEARLHVRLAETPDRLRRAADTLEG